MKEIKRYKCEKCGTEYNDKVEAKKCEKMHIDIKEIKCAKYLPYKNDCSHLPIKIDIEMDNGKIIEYKRI